MLVNQLYNLDFLENYSSLVDEESVDAIITDPPYFILKEEEWDQQWKSRDDFLRWLLRFVKISYDLLKDNRAMFMFCAQYFQAEIDLMIQYETQFKILNRCVWFYPNNHQMYGPATLKLCHEPFFFLLKGQPDKLLPGEMYDVENKVVDRAPIPSMKMDVKTYPMCKSNGSGIDKRVHPSQKPVGLMEELLLCCTHREEIILDPFSGSGSTLVAAKRNDRRYIGFERNPEYIPMTKERLAGGTGADTSPLHRDSPKKQAQKDEQRGLF